MVMVLLPASEVIEAGANETTTPAGAPVAVSATVSAMVPILVSVRSTVAIPPCGTLTFVGMLIEKSESVYFGLATTQSLSEFDHSFCTLKPETTSHSWMHSSWAMVAQTSPISPQALSVHDLFGVGS